MDEWFYANTDDVIMEYMSGLYDPFADLDPPNPAESQVSRTYSCNATADTTTADVTTRTVTQYTYWQKQNKSEVWASPTAPYPRANTDLTTTSHAQIVPNGTTAGTNTGSPTVQWNDLGGTGNNKKWEKVTTTTTTTYSNVVVTPGAPAGSVRPGTYTNIRIGCDTAFAPGIYNIVGGSLTINGQHEVTGSGVMFVLYDGASININGGADVNLTAPLAADLMSFGISADDANKLAGMLVFEDRDGPGAGNNGQKFNGNANTILNGTFYFPVSEVFFAGTAGVTSQCLMIAANNITITGTTNMSTFCPNGSSEDDVVASTASTVRLVA